MEGFVYPNEAMIEWDLLIVIYPYITGLVAGAFIVSSLYHVFGITKLKPVAHFSLITALAFLLVCPLPLILHLGRPERALEMFFRPNFVSAMAGFGYIWTFYLVLVLAEVWLVFRPSIVRNAVSGEGIKKLVYSILSLGVYEVTDESLKIDKKLIRFLAMIGIPAACLLHGYVGFIFGAVKSNVWWSTPLMPIIFLLSAIVSGIALLVVLYAVVMKIRKMPLDYECMHSLALWLGGTLTLAFALEGLEVFSMLYESKEGWTIIQQLISEKITITYLGVQALAGSVLPLIFLASAEIGKMKDRYRTGLRIISSILILIGVFAMRWNVVIGGQLISKSLLGFTSYTPPLFGESGIIVAAVLLVIPFLMLAVLLNLFPPWQEEIKIATPARRLSF
jgi:predicted membrane protein